MKLLPTVTSSGVMMPSPLASLYENGRAKKAFTERPTESRVVPVPMVCNDLPLASLPSAKILLLLCDIAIVTSQPSAFRSRMAVLNSTSTPEFETEDRFFNTVSCDAPDDAAIGWLTRASCVFLL